MENTEETQNLEPIALEYRSKARENNNLIENAMSPIMQMKESLLSAKEKVQSDHDYFAKKQNEIEENYKKDMAFIAMEKNQLSDQLSQIESKITQVENFLK